MSFMHCRLLFTVVVARLLLKNFFGIIIPIHPNSTWTMKFQMKSSWLHDPNVCQSNLHLSQQNLPNVGCCSPNFSWCPSLDPRIVVCFQVSLPRPTGVQQLDPSNSVGFQVESFKIPSYMYLSNCQPWPG
jgi:hypothetical protein